ncbi:sugar-binding domain-containing protein [Knoellia locipacati]
MRHVIGIAHGLDKVAVIAAAVSGGLIDSLVTTAETADALLAQS